MYHLCTIALIFLTAGFTQGVTGFGSALVAMPFLLLFMDAQAAVPLCVLNGLVITFYLSIQLRNNVDWKKILPLLLGSMPGIYVGTSMLKNVDSEIIKALLGIMIISYSLYNLVLKPGPKSISKVWAYGAGFLTGVIGSAFSAGGPPTIIYATLTGWSKHDIKATLSGFFFILGIFIASTHVATGLTTMSVLKDFSLSSLATLFGVWAGSVFYGKIKKDTYMKIVLILLIAMGIMMVVTSL